MVIGHPHRAEAGGDPVGQVADLDRGDDLERHGIDATHDVRVGVRRPDRSFSRGDEERGCRELDQPRHGLGRWVDTGDGAIGIPAYPE